MSINWEIADKDQIIQNARNLISVGMFDIPLNRQIGVSREYLDKRKEEAELLLLSEIDRNIDIYEPRAKLKGLSLEEDGLGDYKINVEIIGEIDMLQLLDTNPDKILKEMLSIMEDKYKVKIYEGIKDISLYLLLLISYL